MKKYIVKIMVLIVIFSNVATPVSYASQIVPVAARNKLISSASVLSLATIDSSLGSAHKRTGMRVQKLTKKDFKADEQITLTLNNPDREQYKTKVVDAEGNDANVALHQDVQGATTDLQIVASNQFKPGKYTVSITGSDGTTSKQDFTWGVLALNPDKSIYQPKETADLAMAVLNDKGNMVCDAAVTLKITNQNMGIDETLSSENGKITVNNHCSSHDYSLEPDYEAHYTLPDEGDYAVQLTAKTAKGTYTISDTLHAQSHALFDVQRISATRLYPSLEYPMQFHITANQDFKGTVTETVPESFAVTEAKDDQSYKTAKTVYINEAANPARVLGQSVLGAATSKLRMPFDGSFSITQGFGLPLTDVALGSFYAQFGLSGHDGVDFGLPIGTPLYSVDDGNVVWAGPGDYGNTVIIQHAWGKSYYGHLSKVNVGVKNHITKGSLLGYSGNSGESTGPHLHFGMKPQQPDMNNGYAGKIDPLPYLGLAGATNTANPAEALSLSFSSAVLGASDAAEQPKARLDEPLLATPSSTMKPLAFSMTNDAITQKVANEQAAPVQKVKVISWDVDLKKGESIKLAYTYKAPQISPQFYLLGPLKFFAKGTNKEIFEETRQWQLAADAVGTDWYNFNWKYRKQITIDHTKVATSNQSNFPVLINLTSDADLLAKARSDGNDILFTNSTGRVQLPHEIELYTNGTGALVAWVKTDISTSADTVLYMYFGNPASANMQSVTSTWDPSYKFVDHLNDGNVSTVKDSTSNASNGTKIVSASEPSSYTSGKIGVAMNFAGGTVANTGISIPSTSISSVTGTSHTFSAWVNANSTPDNTGNNDYAIVGRKGAFIGLSYDGANDFYATTRSTTTSFAAFSGATTYATGGWHYVVQTVDDTGKLDNLYVDGALLQAKVYTGTLRAFTTSDPYMIGRNDPGTDCTANNFSWCMDGIIDEARLASTNRQLSWITTEYNNQNSPSTFYTLGSIETTAYAPTNAQLMRHGKFFDSTGKRQPFVF